MVLALMGLSSLYLASLDGEDRGAFGVPLPLGAMLAAVAGVVTLPSRCASSQSCAVLLRGGFG